MIFLKGRKSTQFVVACFYYLIIFFKLYMECCLHNNMITYHMKQMVCGSCTVGMLNALHGIFLKPVLDIQGIYLDFHGAFFKQNILRAKKITFMLIFYAPGQFDPCTQILIQERGKQPWKEYWINYLLLFKKRMKVSFGQNFHFHIYQRIFRT